MLVRGGKSVKEVVRGRTARGRGETLWRQPVSQRYGQIDANVYDDRGVLKRDLGLDNLK
jgi:hypothetical protein